MSDLDALLAGIVADPANAVRWLVMADWLEENGQPERAELVRVHRELLRTCTATRETKARKQLHARMMELMRAGVQPCIPTRTITLPGGVPMRFSFIPPGSFLMGSPKTEKERGEDEERHLATLGDGFWLGQAPVTQKQWVAVMGKNPSHSNGEELPVETVSWDDAQEYCAAVADLRSVELRLPLEKEWEYAVRAGTWTPYYWGKELDGRQANCGGALPYGTRSEGPDLGTTTPVGTYAGVSPHPWRLVDVIGNVGEWCEGRYSPNPLTSDRDSSAPANNAGPNRVERGGSFQYMASGCRAASRSKCYGFMRSHYVGFRLAADLSALA